MKTDSEEEKAPEELSLKKTTEKNPVDENLAKILATDETDVEDESEDVEEEEEVSEGFTHEGDFDLPNEDPLSEAFDLDQGRPLDNRGDRGRVEERLPHNAYIESAKEFFNSELLYRFDILDESDREQLVGKYRIELKGYQGGVWTLSLGNQLEIVNRKEDADIVLSMSQDDFVCLVNGDLNPQLGILAQKMKVQGDIRKASLFQALLVPSMD